MTETAPPRRAFEALQIRGYRAYLATFTLTMMADNIEHVISYWLVFQKFHSAALGGFAVVSHWLPFLLFSVAAGALNDRFDSRRIIQVGAAMFMTASLGWGVFFVTGTLQMWHAMLLLVLHGCAGVLWMTSSQVLLYDIVGPAALASAVRLNASARYLGVLVGPGVGSLIMLTLGPTRGIFLNAAFYLPLLIWLIGAPYGRHFRKTGAAGPRRAVRGIADIVQTIRDIRGLPTLGAMVLLAADAAGALVAGFLLESRGGLLRIAAGSAMKLALLWAAALFGFAFARTYAVALPLLFAAGFFELSFSSMAQTLVQMEAPDASRGRVLGLFNMASAGLRTFSGVTVGLAGSLVTVHASLAASAGAFAAATGLGLLRQRRR